MQTFFRPAVLAQPSSPLVIDCDNPITRHLLFSTYNAASDYAAGPWNYVTRTACRRNNNVGMAVSALQGAAPAFDGTASAAIALPPLAGVTKFTMSFWLWWNSYTNNSGKFAFQYWNDAGTQGAGTFFVYPDDSSGLFTFSYASSASNQMAGKFTRPSAGAWHFYDWTVDTGAATVCITGVSVDGVAQSLSGSNSYSGPSPVTAQSLSIMCRPAGTPTTFAAGRVANVNIWGRVLTLSERLSMYRNAFQVLRSPMMTIGRPSAAAPPSSAEYRWFLQH